MQKNIYHIVNKIILRLGVGMFLLILILPLVVYKYSLSLLDEMPNKSEILLTPDEFDKLWASHEECTPKECESISPYWVYRWFVVATVNDNVTRMDLNSAYSNVSKMASQIAISHMRQGHIKRVRMLWWHMTHAFLGIWLQRNWSANEIAAKYKLINA